MQTSLLHDFVIGTPLISATYDQFQKSVNRYLLDSTTHQCQYPTKHQSKSRANSNQKKRSRKVDSLSQRVQEHVRLGSNISKTIQRTLSLGAQILQVGGVEKMFMQYFSVREGERLLKVSQCYLSTTSGPLAGLLFISNEKVAFCSERSIKVFNQKGQMRRIRYKVAIPLKKIKCVRQSQNVEKPTQKYINIVTVDNFDFWLMGVLKYQKTFKYLEQICFEKRDFMDKHLVVALAFHARLTNENRYTWFIHIGSAANFAVNILLIKLLTQEIIRRVLCNKPQAVTVNIGTKLAESIHSSTERPKFEFNEGRLLFW